MSEDRSTIVRQATYNRMPGHVTQIDWTVRVFRHSPELVQIQVRNPKHYMTASLTSTEAREIANLLLAAADDADKKFVA
jgi:hypothetical protein